MKCPSCKSNTLFPSFIEASFRSHTCKTCKGNWVLIEDYVFWSTRQSFNTHVEEVSFDLEDSTKALLCPMTGRIMMKYKINNLTDHKLDYSPSVGGVWLDSGEWEYLKTQGLANALGRIFTESWQREIRAGNTKATLEELYKSKFGEHDYQKLKEIREWVSSLDNKEDARSYLLSKDPYSV